MLIPLGFWAASGAGSTGSYDLIQTQVIAAGGVTGLNFTSIPQTYKHLQLRLTYQVNTSSSNEYGLVFATEGSTTDNSKHWLTANGSTVYSNAESNTTQINRALIPYPQTTFIGGSINPSSYQSQFVAGIVDILDYASISKNKTLRSFSGHTIGGTNNVTLASMLITDTAAISSFTVFPSNGPAFTIGSRFSLYGIKG